MKWNVTAIGEILWDVYPDMKRLGGAPFNFIYHIWKISGKGNFISRVGDDQNGNEIFDYLKSNQFPTNYIGIDNNHPTGTVKVKLQDSKIPQFTISTECSYDYITIDDKDKLLIEKDTNLLYFGTLSQRSNMTRTTIRSLFGKEYKYFCDLNLRHDFFSAEIIKESLNVSNVIKLNSDELDIIINLFNLDSNNNKAIEQIRDLFEIDLICITLGEHGALLFDGKKFDHYKADTKKIVDTVGAGDAFAAILCLGYLKKMNIEKINVLANQFALEMCGIEGAVPKDDSVYHKYIGEFENDS